MHGRPAPTRSTFVPVTPEFGPGYWKTSETDFHGVKNAAVMMLNRATSMGAIGEIMAMDSRRKG